MTSSPQANSTTSHCPYSLNTFKMSPRLTQPSLLLSVVKVWPLEERGESKSVKVAKEKIIKFFMRR